MCVTYMMLANLVRASVSNMFRYSIIITEIKINVLMLKNLVRRENSSKENFLQCHPYCINPDYQIRIELKCKTNTLNS